MKLRSFRIRKAALALSNEQSNEIAVARESEYQTKRPSVPALEKELFVAHPVLDHGFVRVVDYMGDDSSVVQAARVSYGRGTKQTNEDRALINYLMRQWHTTPFEMAEIKFHVKLPIFVARQWIRHRTSSFNEYSARYSILDNEFYIPEANILAAQSTKNRQGRGDVLDSDAAAAVMVLLRDEANRAYGTYTWLLNEDQDGEVGDASRVGLARELARMSLTLNTYTQWYWKVNLHNLLNFLRLRADSHAQYEIRVYAEKILDLVRLWVPQTYEAFVEHRMEAKNLSSSAVKALRRALAGEKVNATGTGLSKREWEELVNVFPEILTQP